MTFIRMVSLTARLASAHPRMLAAAAIGIVIMLAVLMDVGIVSLLFYPSVPKMLAFAAMVVAAFLVIRNPAR